MKTPNEIKAAQTHFFADLCDIMQILRSENGCPWDREQTHKSIRNNLIEEAYEVVEGIDNDDSELLEEELGDLLLQVIFHARISEEEGKFDINSVINGICEKLIIRHPHIFGDVKVDGTKEVLENWDAIKQKTKKRKSTGEELDGICRSLPSLVRAQKISKKLGKKGEDDCLNIDGEAKISEINEANIGEFLYKIAEIASEIGVDAEEKLYITNEQIINEKLI